MKRHAYIFLQGLAVVAPLVITVYVIYACVNLIDAPMRRLLGNIFPETFPGLGFITAIILIYLVGLCVRYFFLQNILHHLNCLIDRIPLVKSIYGAVKNLLMFFGVERRQKGQVVKIPVGDGKSHMLGIVMKSEQGHLAGKEPLPVYLPMSYNLGGFLVYVPRERLEIIDMDVESAIKLVLTAGIETSSQEASSHKKVNAASGN